MQIQMQFKICNKFVRHSSFPLLINYNFKDAGNFHQLGGGHYAGQLNPSIGAGPSTPSLANLANNRQNLQQSIQPYQPIHQQVILTIFHNFHKF
jgi:hypothetical protein